MFACLAKLPDNCVDCVVTSPPYWGLRDYGVDGQLGLEHRLGEHIEVMVRVFREVRRVLKPPGTLWLNYGDSYATAPNGRSAAHTKAAGNDDRTFRDKPFSTVGPIYSASHEKGDRRGGNCKQRTHDSGHEQHKGRIVAGGILKPKDLCMIPNRLAIALQDDGWFVRSEIIWAKPNPMPESIKDRPASTHEKIWLLTKNGKYFFDADAIAEPVTGSTHARVSQNVAAQRGSDRANGGRKTNGPMRAVVRRPGVTPKSADEGTNIRAKDSWYASTTAITLQRNARNVWTIPTAAFSDAHFATFPPELVERCLKAGCPKGGTVLDPFGGSGTTALVADGLGMDSVLVELNPAYVEIARKRLSDMFRHVAVEVIA